MIKYFPKKTKPLSLEIKASNNTGYIIELLS